MERTYLYGEEVTLTATPDECCEFLYWVEETNPCIPVSYDQVFTFVTTENTSYIPIFRKKQFHVEVTSNLPEFCCITGNGLYDCGADVIITIKTACGGITWNNTLLNHNSDISENNGVITLTYTISEITEDFIEGVTLEVCDCTVDVFVCSPNDNMSTALIVTANNTPNHNTTEYICNSFDTEPIDPCDYINPQIHENTYEALCGSEVTLLAIPGPGSVFYGWATGNSCDVCNGHYISEDRVFSTVIDNDVTYVACFESTPSLRCTTFTLGVKIKTNTTVEILIDDINSIFMFIVIVEYEGEKMCVLVSFGETLKIPVGSNLSILWYFPSCRTNKEIITFNVYDTETGNESTSVSNKKTTIVTSGLMAAFEMTQYFDECGFNTRINMISFEVNNINEPQDLLLEWNFVASPGDEPVVDYPVPCYDVSLQEYTGDFLSKGVNVFGCVNTESPCASLYIFSSINNMSIIDVGLFIEIKYQNQNPVYVYSPIAYAKINVPKGSNVTFYIYTNVEGEKDEITLQNINGGVSNNILEEEWDGRVNPGFVRDYNNTPTIDAFCHNVLFTDLESGYNLIKFDLNNVTKSDIILVSATYSDTHKPGDIVDFPAPGADDYGLFVGQSLCDEVNVFGCRTKQFYDDFIQYLENKQNEISEHTPEMENSQIIE